MIFERYVVIRNPASTDTHKTESRIKELKKIVTQDRIVVLDTMPDGQAANALLLQQHQALLGRRTLLCIGGGDGTVHLVLNTLLGDNALSETARHTPILPLWAGNANDLAYMLNGSPLRTSLAKMLRLGKVVAIHPLMCKLAHADGHTTTFVASNYAGFGASGFTLKKMERSLRTRSPMRQFAVSRMGLELVEVTRLLMRAPRFRILEDGKESLIFERVFLKGSRFAKIAAVPLKLTEKRFHRATVNHRDLPTILLRFAELNRDKIGRKVGSIHDSFTVLDDIWAQFDGEPVKVPAGTTIDISLSPQPFYALSNHRAP
jgi:diacylglycerol kinase family enzyme